MRGAAERSGAAQGITGATLLPLSPNLDAPSAPKSDTLTLVVIQPFVCPAGLELQPRPALPAHSTPAPLAKVQRMPAARKPLQPLRPGSGERLDGGRHVGGPGAHVAAGGCSTGGRRRGRLAEMRQHCCASAGGVEAKVHHLGETRAAES